jgi:hypothetical protein
MESRDLNPHDEARLEAWLRASARLPDLADDGFSARVLAALPAAATRRLPRGRRRALLLCTCATAAGAALTLAGPAGLARLLAALGEALIGMAGAAATPAGAWVALGTIGALALAYWGELRALVKG